MYGLIVNLRAHPGRGTEVAHHLIGLHRSMPGCLSHIVALDASDPDLLWVTEIWEDEAAHRAWREAFETQAAISSVLAGVIPTFRAETRPLPWHL